MRDGSQLAARPYRCLMRRRMGLWPRVPMIEVFTGGRKRAAEEAKHPHRPIWDELTDGPNICDLHDYPIIGVFVSLSHPISSPLWEGVVWLLRRSKSASRAARNCSPVARN